MDIPNPDLLMEFIFLDCKFQSMTMILKILIFCGFKSNSLRTMQDLHFTKVTLSCISFLSEEKGEGMCHCFN